MTSPELGALRLARALGFGLTAFALSVTAHVVAGGPPPSATVSLVLGFAVVWASVFLTWRRLGVVSSVLSLGALQVVLHAALSLASAGATCMSVVHGHASHAADGAMTMCTTATASHAHSDGASGLAMTAAHALAAVVLGVLLARADQAVWFLAALIWPSLPQATPGAAGVPQARVAVVRSRVRPPVGVVLTGVSRRGPPRGLALADV
jgi:hypothetical protein